MESIIKKAYVAMLKGRLLDDFVSEELLGKGRAVAHYHPGQGQEALSAGTAICLNKDDYFFYTHRGTASLFAKGLSLRDVMYDLFFRNGEGQAGTNRGCGSKMHTYAPEYGIVGRNGVFGTRFTFSTGLAYSSMVRNDGKVTLCMYGEAEGSRGQFYEALNMAVRWKMPVVFVAEHNGFSVDSRTDDMYALNTLAKQWRGYEIPVKQFDGNDIIAVTDAVNEAINLARDQKGPSVLEGITYRTLPHSPMDKNQFMYRTQEELDVWSAKDPVVSTKKLLIEQKELSEEDDVKFRNDIRKEIRDVYVEAMAAPDLVAEEEVYKAVYYSIPESAIKL